MDSRARTPDAIGGNAAPAHAVEAVAAGDEIAGDLVRDALVAIRHRGAARRCVQRHVLGFIDARRAGRGARLHEIARHLGLAIDRDALARQLLKGDAMAPPAEADLDTVVHQSFGVQARGHARALEHVDCALLEHAGADPAEHVLRAAPFEKTRVDTLRAAAARAAVPQVPRRR